MGPWEYWWLPDSHGGSADASGHINSTDVRSGKKPVWGWWVESCTVGLPSVINHSFWILVCCPIWIWTKWTCGMTSVKMNEQCLCLRHQGMGSGGKEKVSRCFYILREVQETRRGERFEGGSVACFFKRPSSREYRTFSVFGFMCISRPQLWANNNVLKKIQSTNRQMSESLV